MIGKPVPPIPSLPNKNIYKNTRTSTIEICFAKTRVGGKGETCIFGGNGSRALDHSPIRF